MDTASRNTSILVPDDEWFIGLTFCFLIAWAILSGILYWVLSKPDAKPSLSSTLVLVFIVTLCQWASFHPFIGKQTLAVALVLDICVLLGVGALFFFVSRQLLCQIMGLAGILTVLAAGYILWLTPFLSEIKYAASKRPRTNLATYHREFAPKETPKVPNVYHILLDGFQKEYYPEVQRRAGLGDELKEFDVLDD